MPSPDLSHLSTNALARLLRTDAPPKARRLVREELYRRQKESDKEYVHVNRMNAFLARNRKPGTPDGTRRSPRITRFAWRGL